MTSEMPPATAAMLVIGDEILSGRTKDKNVGHLAEVLTSAGIDLTEVRIVADRHQAIVEALNALRQAYDLVFTSGGIGPTHDDITAEAVAAAFDVPIGPHPDAVLLMAAHYEQRGLEFTEARQRMARTPSGATLIDNPVSVAPGFTIGNVHVMAGVPTIFAAMLANLMTRVPAGRAIRSVAISCPLAEGVIGGPLGEIQRRHAEVSIGSYPQSAGERYSTELVLRSRDDAALEAARAEVVAMIDRLAQ